MPIGTKTAAILQVKLYTIGQASLQFVPSKFALRRCDILSNYSLFLTKFAYVSPMSAQKRTSKIASWNLVKCCKSCNLLECCFGQFVATANLHDPLQTWMNLSTFYHASLHITMFNHVCIGPRVQSWIKNCEILPGQWCTCKECKQRDASGRQWNM